MTRSIDALLNSFAIRSFRETADKDYITARMAYKARLIQPYLWSALHCLEKYVKGICLLNRVKAQKGHSVLKGIKIMEEAAKFPIQLSEHTRSFIERLEDNGAEFRYYETSYQTHAFDILRLDCAVWEIRRYCQPIDYEITLQDGSKKNMLETKLSQIKNALKDKDKGTCISNGTLEEIISNKNHPARSHLIWQNLYFGPSSRKSVKIRRYTESGNTPFFLNPEIIDELEKYVFIPKHIAEGVRQYALKKSIKTD